MEWIELAFFMYGLCLFTPFCIRYLPNVPFSLFASVNIELKGARNFFFILSSTLISFFHKHLNS